jgi:hypothetical protein
VTPGCPSQLRLDEWIAGRRSPELAAHVGGCARCTDRIAVLETDRAAFTLRARPAAFADAVLARRRPLPWQRRWISWLTLAVATACALLLWLRPRGTPGGSGDDAYEGYKGPPVSASLYVKQDGKVAPYDRSRVVRAGDLLQVIVTANQPTHVAVVDLEDGGKQSVLFTTDQPLRAGRTALPRSFELDSWTGGETIVILFGDPSRGDPIARATHGEGDRFILRRK